MLKIQSCFTLFLILVIYPIVVFATCKMEFIKSPPILVRNFGSRKVVQSNPSTMYLSVGEEVEVYCSSNLLASWNRNWYLEEDNVQSASLQCSSRGLTFKNHRFTGVYEDAIEIGCSSWSVKLYESNSTLPNCENYMSYAIGIKSLEEAEPTTAICYDLDSLSIRYAKYLTYKQKNNLLPSEESFKKIPFISLDTELNNLDSLFSFIGANEFLSTYQEKQTKNVLLTNQYFDFESLIEDKDHGSYVDIFNIMWWHNLRIGNWNFFMKALNERIQNVTYMAHTGISGSLTIPSFQNCKTETEILELHINRKTTKAPAFIYTYLKSLEPNIEEDFVVIGYNTPFYTVNKETEICKDMCDKIDWLNKSLFGKTHLMPVYGVVICCHPDEVVNKLENFPYVADKTITSTQSPV